MDWDIIIRYLFQVFEIVILTLIENGVFGCGSNDTGRLGIGTKDKEKNIPKRLNFFDGKKIKQISLGAKYSLILI